MKSKMTNANWEKMKDRIKDKWNKLTDEDIDCLRENLDDLVGVLQTTYCYAKERAEVEYEDFKKSLDKVKEKVSDTISENRSYLPILAASLVVVASVASLVKSLYQSPQLASRKN